MTSRTPAIAEVGRAGLFSGFLRPSRGGEEALGALRDAEAQGWPAVWVSGAMDGQVLFDDLGAMLAGTQRITVAVGIMNLWALPPAAAAGAYSKLEAAHPGRLLFGLGVSHPEVINREGAPRYGRPVAAMSAYLDEIDAAPSPIPVENRVVAALGPRMLRLAGARARGAHPYFVPVEHTAAARKELGAGPFLAPEQAVIIEADPGRARAAARQHMATYLGLRNYTNNLLRFGFTHDDLADGGSDRLVDAVVAWGDADAVARRLQAHLAAGADHVAVQVLPAGTERFPRHDWAALAAALSIP